MKKNIVLLVLLTVLLFTGCVNPFGNVMAPSNPSPADGEADIQETTVNLSWSGPEASNGGLVYDLYVGTDPNPVCIAVGLKDSSYSYGINEQLLGYEYYWKVVARNSLGARTEGPVWTFKTGPELLASFGEYGLGEGELFRPSGIAVDSLGNVYVTDNRLGYEASITNVLPLGTVVKYDSEGNFVTEWSFEGEGNGSMFCGIVTYSQDNLFVISEYPSSDGLSHVLKYTPDGTLLTGWSLDDQFGLVQGFEAAGNYYNIRSECAAMDSQDNLYLTYYTSDLLKAGVMVFTSDGATVTEFGAFGSDEGEFFTPYGIALDSNDDVYVADPENRSVQKFSKEGNYIETVGEFGSEICDFTQPAYVTIDSGDNVYVYDGSYKIFDSDFNFRFAWRDESIWSRIMTIDSRGYIFALDEKLVQVDKFSPLK